MLLPYMTSAELEAKVHSVTDEVDFLRPSMMP